MNGLEERGKGGRVDDTTKRWGADYGDDGDIKLVGVGDLVGARFIVAGIHRNGGILPYPVVGPRAGLRFYVLIS